tara:strand:+ start:455 stop:763 length:309 start_codon:yes stop_codon:yes gene_type:complete
MKNQVQINGEVFIANQLRLSTSVPTKMMFEDLLCKVDLIFSSEESGKGHFVTIGQFPFTNPNNTNEAIQTSHTEAMQFAHNFAISISNYFHKRFSITLPISL